MELKYKHIRELRKIGGDIAGKDANDPKALAIAEDYFVEQGFIPDADEMTPDAVRQATVDIITSGYKALVEKN